MALTYEQELDRLLDAQGITSPGYEFKRGVGDLGSAFIGGLQGGVANVIDAGGYVADTLGADSLSKWLYENAAEWERDAAARNAQLYDPTSFANRVVGGIGSSLPMMVPGVALGGAGALLGAGKGLAGALLTGTLGASEAAGNAGQLYRQKTAEGMDAELAKSAANKLFLTEAPIDIASEHFLGMFGGNWANKLVPNPLIRTMIGEGLQEGAQETYQGIFQSAAEKSAGKGILDYGRSLIEEGRNAPEIFMNEGLPAVVSGALMGGVGGIRETMQARRARQTPQQKQTAANVQKVQEAIGINREQQRAEQFPTQGPIVAGQTGSVAMQGFTPGQEYGGQPALGLSALAEPLRSGSGFEGVDVTSGFSPTTTSTATSDLPGQVAPQGLSDIIGGTTTPTQAQPVVQPETAPTPGVMPTVEEPTTPAATATSNVAKVQEAIAANMPAAPTVQATEEVASVPVERRGGTDENGNFVLGEDVKRALEEIASINDMSVAPQNPAGAFPTQAPVQGTFSYQPQQTRGELFTNQPTQWTDRRQETQTKKQIAAEARQARADLTRDLIAAGYDEQTAKDNAEIAVRNWVRNATVSQKTNTPLTVRYQYERDKVQRGISPQENGQTYNQIIGKKGVRNLDETKQIRADYRVAQQMEKSGKDAKTIRLATGWERGADGQWRYEIPDGTLKFPEAKDPKKLKQLQKLNRQIVASTELINAGRDDAKGSIAAIRNIHQQEYDALEDSLDAGPYRLGDIYTNDDLYKAYPRLKSLKVTQRSGVEFDGLYDPETKTITLDKGLSDEEKLSTLIHEVQHAVQDIEGFAWGGDEESAKTAKRENISQTRAEMRELKKQYPYIRDYESFIAQGGNWREANRIINSWPQEVRNRYWKLSDRIDTLKEARSGGDAYNLLAGEVEARNAEIRSEYTSEERRKTLLQTTEDKPRNSQIVTYSQSAPRSAEAKQTATLQETATQQTGQDIVELNAATVKDPESRAYLREQMHARGMIDEDVDAMLALLDGITDDVLEISKKYPLMAKWQEQEPERAWSKLRGLVPVRSAFKKNGEYPVNFDFGALCTKREAMDMLVQILASKGLTQQLGPTQIEALKSMLKDEGFLTACDICFVESKRVRMLNDANKTSYAWKSVLLAAGIDDDLQIGKARTLTDEQLKRLRRMASTGEKGEYLDAYKEYMPEERRRTKTKGDEGTDLDTGITPNTMGKIAKLFLQDAEAGDGRTTTLAGELKPDLLLSTAGTDWLVRTYGGHTNIYNTLAGMYGSATSKPLEGFNIFDNLSFRKDFDFKALSDNNKFLYDIGGSRSQSFTDFNPLLFLDYVQLISELQVRGMPMQVYTKVLSHPQLFGLTGMMINMSLVPDIVEGVDAEHAGMKPDGRGGWAYAWSEDSFPIKEAFALRKRKEYGGRVGTIAVGVSDAHILKMLSDPEIDMVIPYHSSGMPFAVKIKTGLIQATDYTDVQETKNVPTGQRFNYNEALQRLGDPRKAASEYLQWCKDIGATPRFPQFANHENYYKLLEDFRGYDNAGKPVIQGPVRLNLPKNWKQTLDSALADRTKQVARMAGMANNKTLMKKALAILKPQRLDGELRENMMKRLKKLLGASNVVTMRQTEFLDALEASYGKRIGAEAARSQVEVFRQGDGVVYGFADNGKIVLNELTFNANTPAHEFTHVWAKVAQMKNAELWAEGKELLKQHKLWNEVANDPMYKNIAGNEDAIASEVLARFVGQQNEDFIRSMLDPTVKMQRGNNLVQQIRDWFMRMFEEVRSLFSKDNKQPLTFDEFIRMPMKTLWTGDLKTIKEAAQDRRFQSAVKKLQKQGEVAAVDAQTEMMADRNVADDSSANVFNQPAWHGSPHTFDKFDLGAIGTGEGAQVHGWGLYFTKNKEVAEGYRDTLLEDAGGGASFVIDGKQIDEDLFDRLTNYYYEFVSDDSALPWDDDIDEMLHNADAEEARGIMDTIREGMQEEVERIDDALSENPGDPDNEELLRKRTELVTDLGEMGKMEIIQKPVDGSVFEVDVPEDDVLLDEQKTLKEQPKTVRAAVRKIIQNMTDEQFEDVGEDIHRIGRAKAVSHLWGILQDSSGRQVYGTFIDLFGGPRAASEALNNAGVKGITYFGGTDGRCFVVFDDKAISVIERYNQEVAKDTPQDYSDLVRAQIKIENNGGTLNDATITLFSTADRSSFIHEFGHKMLDDVISLGTNPDAGKVFADDLKVVMDWFGVKDVSEIGVEQHEQFARGFERYLMEGKAPTSKLAEVFEHFKQWLVDIYKHVSGLDVELSPEIRDLFDRLLGKDIEEQSTGTQSATITGPTLTERGAAFQTQQGRDYSMDYATGTPSTPTPTPASVKKSRVTIRDIAARLNEIRPWRKGVNGPKNVLGYTNPTTRVARTRWNQDWTTATHEIGHIVDYQLRLRQRVNANLSAEIDTELQSLGQNTSPPNSDAAYLRKEGIAEFFRLRAIVPQLAESFAPKYSELFDEALADDPDLQQKVNAIFDVEREYWEMSPEEKVRAGLRQGDEKEPRGPISGVLKAWWEKRREEFDDRFRRIERLQEVMRDRAVAAGRTDMLQNGQLKDEYAPYDMVRTAPGFLGKAKTDVEAIMDPIRKLGTEAYDQLVTYMTARGAIDYWNNGMEPGIATNRQQTEDVIRRFEQEHPDLVKAYDEILKAYENMVRRTMVDSGVWSEQQYEAYKKKYPNYVPFIRVNEDGSLRNPGSAGGNKVVNLSNQVKRRKGVGSEHAFMEIADPYESMVKNILTYHKIAEKNRVGQTFINAVKADPGVFADLIEPVEGNEIGKDSFYVWEDGKKKYFAADKDILNAINALEEAAPDHLIAKAAMKASNWLKFGATRANFAFIITNFVRDGMFSTMTGSGWGVPFYRTVKGLAMQMSKDPETAKRVAEALDSGLAYSGITELDMNSSRESIAKSIKRALGDDSLFSKVTSAWDNSIGRINEMIEVAPKYAEYEKLVKQGYPKRYAARMAREVNLDFSRGGSVAKNINRYVAFFNPAIQGVSKIARTAAANPGKFLAKTALYVMIPSIISWAMGHDDDEYKRLSRSIKDRYWVFKTPGGTWVRISKPDVVGQFGSAVERMLDKAADKDPAAFRGLGTSIAEAVFPSYMPTVLGPLMETWSNKSFFYGERLIPQSLEKLPKEMQYRRDTSELAKGTSRLISSTAKFLGQEWGVSPIIIDNLIKGYTGGVGEYISKIPDQFIKPEGEARKFSERPVISRFTVDPYRSSESINRFYDIREKTETAKNGFKALAKQGERGEVSRDVKAAKMFEKAGKQISDWNKDIARIREAKNLTPEQKRQRIDRINLERNKLAEKVLARYDAME